jgi:hypothetical protein
MLRSRGTAQLVRTPVEAGLLDAAALAVEDDPAVLLVAALERWLARAEKIATVG